MAVQSAKGNPASKRMSNPAYKAKRAKNKSKNESLKARGEHPKQLRNAANLARHEANRNAEPKPELKPKPKPKPKPCLKRADHAWRLTTTYYVKSRDDNGRVFVERFRCEKCNDTSYSMERV